MHPFFLFAGAFGHFCLADLALTRVGVKGAYYLIHGIHNAAIAWLTWRDVQTTFIAFDAAPHVGINYEAVALVFALHFYHIWLYWKKLQMDDYLHHGLMIFVALPIGLIVPSGSLLGFNLFFTTGFPTILDYFLLTGVRNGFVHPLTEKRVNHQLQLWLRAPGCIAQATASAIMVLSNHQPWWMIIPSLLTYWNGLYFANQVIVNHAERELLERQPAN
jgi:hypothetical protein